MKTQKTTTKTYSYAINHLNVDDDVHAAIKRLAKARRMPAYRLASDVPRRWCEREERKESR